MTAATPSFDLPTTDAPWRTRLAAVLHEFWSAMRAAHHERIPY